MVELTGVYINTYQERQAVKFSKVIKCVSIPFPQPIYVTVLTF